MHDNIYSEKTLQQNVIQLLTKMGYIFIPRDKNISLRKGNLSDVILQDILISQLNKINSYEYKGVINKFSEKNILRAIEELDVPLNEGLLSANQKISDKLILGTSYEESPENDSKGYTLNYIDFKNLENNLFHFTEEFSVNCQSLMEQTKTRRPDIVLFINGIPFGVIELKKSSVDTILGINQMLNNQLPDEIPQLFKYIQITVAGNNFNPQYATTGTPAKFYALWEEEHNDSKLTQLINERTISKLDQTIYSLFNQSRVLQLIHSFILFDKRVKKIARYPQYFALQNILQKINQIDENGTRGGGLIWHTQGSGKSLTMVMLTKLLKQIVTGSRIIVVTDRRDLDKQIHETFMNSEIKARRANSGHDLIDKLQSGISVITTLIHKFDTVKNENMVLNDRNIFVLVDESHRTQGGDLHKAMKKTFPYGCYLGFTGTPLLAKHKRDGTLKKFGGLIHKYTIEQAVRDKAVLPLLYEGRTVDQWINDKNGLDKRFELISRNLTPEQQDSLKQKWARFQKIASSERRLEMIALDINEHFRLNLQNTGFKAMLATQSKYEAIKYHELFENYAQVKTAFIISAPGIPEGNEDYDDDSKQYVSNSWGKIIKEYGSEEAYLDKTLDEFIQGDDIELLIVVDKLLTGFDAPRTAVLYVDKILKEHNLLQAIARVNRLYEGKNAGFIIDYRGLLGDLDCALSSYAALAGFDEEDIIGAVTDIREEIARVKTFYSYLEELFKPIKNKSDLEEYQVFLGDKTLRKEFYELLSKFARALKLSLSSDKYEEIISQDEINLYKNKMRFFSELRIALKTRYHEQVDFGKYEKDMQKLLDTFISANEVNKLTKLINIFENTFDNELEQVVGNNAKADTILSATAKTITDNREKNPAFYDNLSKKIDDILIAYKEGRMSDEEKLKHAQDVRTILTFNNTNAEEKYPNAIRSSGCARALFDNLAPIITKLPQEDLIQAILKIDSLFKQVTKKPDWQYNVEVHNQLEQNIDDIFYVIEQKFNFKLHEITKIITQIRSIGINNYAK